MFVRLTEKVFVAGQIAPDDLTIAAREGFVAVVNNRPDGETADQPACDEMRAAAVAAGAALRCDSGRS